MGSNILGFDGVGVVPFGEQEEELQRAISDTCYTVGYRRGQHDAAVGNPFNDGRDQMCGEDYASGYRKGWRRFVQEHTK